ncbi:hypothetical protein ES703_83023 [subsurface metagenome]
MICIVEKSGPSHERGTIKSYCHSILEKRFQCLPFRPLDIVERDEYPVFETDKVGDPCPFFHPLVGQVPFQNR